MKTDPISAAFRECRPLLAGALLFSFLISLLNLAVPLYSMQVLDRVLSSGSKDTLMMLTIIVVASVLFMGLLQGLRALVFGQVGRWLDDRLAEDIVGRALRLALLKPGVGAQPIRDLTAIRGFVTSPTFGTMLDAPWVVIFFAALYMINMTIGVVVTIAAVILLGLAWITQKAPSKRLAAASDAQVRALAALETTLRNAEAVRAMGMEKTATGAWRAANAEALSAGYAAGNFGAVISNATKTFRMGVQILITGLGAWLVIQGEMSMGAIIAVNILAGKALAPFDAGVAIYQSLVTLRKARGRLEAVFAVEDEAAGNLELPEPQGAVAAAALGYQAPGSGAWLLKAVSLEIEAGASLGVIGPSGGGKTTLARLLVGVKAPTTGAVAIDGAAISQWRPDQLAAAIGYLPQDVELFTGTVAENIARMNAEADDAAIVAAAKLAEVHDFILALPDGYQTHIGENGAALSAGQRQRIGLARCFYGGPKLVVLDEPNANLDTDGDNALIQCLKNAKAAGITTVTIAHRPALLHHVDHIAVLAKGELALHGPAKEVLERLAGANKSAKPLRIDRAAG